MDVKTADVLQDAQDAVQAVACALECMSTACIHGEISNDEQLGLMANLLAEVLHEQAGAIGGLLAD